MVGVYKLVFSDCSYYVGSSADIERRYKDHCGFLRRNKHTCKKLQQRYNTLNELPNIEILTECCEDELLNKEREFLDNGSGEKLNISINFGQDIDIKIVNPEKKIIIHYIGNQKKLSSIIGISEGKLSELLSGRRLAANGYILHNTDLFKTRQYKHYGTVIKKDNNVEVITSSELFYKKHKIPKNNFNWFMLGKTKSCYGWEIIGKCEYSILGFDYQIIRGQ